MTDYKWVICDLDGTLLNSDSTLSEENTKAIKDLMLNGINVILATGRLDTMAKIYIDKLNIKNPVISCNGGLIRNPETGEILYIKLIDKGLAKEILNFILSNNLNFLIYTPDMVYYSENNPRIPRYSKLNESVREELRMPLASFKNQVLDIDDLEIIKILILSENLDLINELMENFKFNEELEVVSSAKGFLDIMAYGVTKGNALKILGKKLNIDFEKAAAFGDNYNDISMLELVKLPITMENGEESIKEMAKFITLSNDEAGVAYAVYHKIL
jgi:Cof subfamily protein (haloacid dehalogenase superfamily)